MWSLKSPEELINLYVFSVPTAKNDGTDIAQEASVSVRVLRVHHMSPAGIFASRLHYCSILGCLPVPAHFGSQPLLTGRPQSGKLASNKGGDRHKNCARSSFPIAPVSLRATMRTKCIAGLCTLILLVVPQLEAQTQSPTVNAGNASRLDRGIGYLFNYLNMAGTKKATEFQPLSQKERTQLYFKTMVNPLGYGKAAFSAGIDQWKDKPEEWEQGASGYGKRFANILGQYSVQRTATYGLASLLHEDNRYFNSGKKGFWARTSYALCSAVLARHDDGSRAISISQLSGVAAGAFVARLWLPPSQDSAKDGAVSFGITMGSNAAFSVVKEYLPDLGRAIAKKYKKPSPESTESTDGSTSKRP